MSANTPYDIVLTSDPLHSRRVWTVVIDCVVSLALYFSAKYLAPALADDVKFIVAALQPAIIVALAFFTYDDHNARATTVKLAQARNFSTTLTTVPTYLAEDVPLPTEDNVTPLKESEPQRE